jgi:hypothetical protein
VLAQAAQQVDHTAAWLAFFGVLGVAIIAAATAQWRQWAEHKHDRAMRDLDDLRIVLDHGYDAADGSLRSLADAGRDQTAHRQQGHGGASLDHGGAPGVVVA